MTKQRANPLQSAVAGLGLLVISTMAAHAVDTSSFVNVSADYNARDVLTSQPVYGGFSVHNGQVHTWVNDWTGNPGYIIGDITSNIYTTVGKPAGGVNSNGYGDAFGIYDHVGQRFYVGTYNFSGSGLYSYDVATQSWSDHGAFDSLYGVAVQDGQVYASGLNAIWNGSAGQANQIALYDLSGTGQHDVIIQASGNSAHVAVDAAGNVYYANYGDSSSALYRWSFEDINLVRADLGNGGVGGGIDDIFLTYDDAIVLTLLPSGGNGIAIDEAGNVFVTVNGTESSLLMWNESMGVWDENDPFHFQRIASGTSGWLGALDTEGDFLNGGSVYISGGPGITEITMAVPEPSTYALLVLSVCGIYLWRRNRRGPA